MAIKLHIKNKEQFRKKVFPESIERLAKTVFDRWREGAEKGDGGMTTHISPMYFRAVQLGFVGHQGKWIDKVLAAGGISMDDFPDAYPEEDEDERKADARVAQKKRGAVHVGAVRGAVRSKGFSLPRARRR